MEPKLGICMPIYFESNSLRLYKVAQVVVIQITRCQFNLKELYTTFAGNSSSEKYIV